MNKLIALVLFLLGIGFALLLVTFTGKAKDYDSLPYDTDAQFDAGYDLRRGGEIKI